MENQFKHFFEAYFWLMIFIFFARFLISVIGLTELNINFNTICGYAGEAIGFSSIIMALYERILWRVNPFCKVPKLAKKYTGTLTSSHDSTKRDISIVIKQSLLSVNVILITEESRSNSIMAFIDEILGERQLIYTYLNKPYAEYRDKSEIHYGTATLCVEDPKNINGQYYTDRKTRGDINLHSVERSTKPKTQ